MKLIPGLNNLDLFGISPDANAPLSELEKWLRTMEYPWLAIRNLNHFVEGIIESKKKKYSEHKEDFVPRSLGIFSHEDCVLEPNITSEGFIMCGHHTKIESGCRITGNVVIGDHCIIESDCRITGNVVIGNNSHLHHGVTITGCSKAGPSSVYIGNNVNIYQHSVVKASIMMDGANIYSGSYVPVSIIGPNARVGSQNSFDDAKIDENQLIVIQYKLESIQTELKRLGVMIGSNTKMKSGVTADPGTIVAPNQIIPRNETIQGLIGMEK